MIKFSPALPQMSSQRGNIKRSDRKSAHGPSGAPRYMNDEGFHNNKGSKMTKIVNAAPIYGICQRCHDVSTAHIRRAPAVPSILYPPLCVRAPPWGAVVGQR